MGQLSELFADHVIITSDNPRSEDPAEIRRAASAPVSEVRINAAKARSGRAGCRNRGAISGAITIRRSGPKFWASRLAKRADCGAGRVSNRVLARDCVAMPQVLPRRQPLWQRQTMTDLTFLGIESSCDDTAAAVVRVQDGVAQILSSVVEGQTALHAAFGGVVPEIAARAHAERLDHCVEAALAQAGLTRVLCEGGGGLGAELALDPQVFDKGGEFPRQGGRQGGGGEGCLSHEPARADAVAADAPADPAAGCRCGG